MTGGRELRKEIVELLVNLPAAYDPNGRKALLLRSGLDEVLREIDCTGAPSDFATRIVVQLYQFGSLQRGQHALDALLEGLKNHVGLDRQAEIETLRERLRVHLADLEALGLKSYISTDGDFVSAEEIQKAVYQFLEAIENEFKYVPIFHPPHKIVLQDHYIPIEVTLERRYRHVVETSWGYAEGEAEFARAYAMKGFEEQKEETRRVQVPWKKAKEQHKRLIVLADPGMGKTALLKMEAVLGAQAPCLPNSPLEGGRGVSFPSWEGPGVGNIIFPLFFRLSEFADTDEEIAETIPRLLQRNYPDTAPAILPLIAEKLKNGTCLLLLDALDEVPQEQRNRLSDKLNRFARHYPCPIIVTSRIVGYGGGILHDAKEVEIVPFTRKQIDQYIEIWFKNAEESLKDSRSFENSGSLPDAKGLINELQQKPQIRGLAQNPLLLSLLCSLYQEGELTLPARRVQVYKHAVEYMLKDWTRNRKPQTEGRIRAKLRLLEELAYQFSCEYKEIFTADDLYDKIEAYLHSDTVSSVFKQSNSEVLISELTEEDGIIQKLDREDKRYLFLHRTFQEYLTASYVNRQQNRVELAKPHFRDVNWNEPLGLLAGLMYDPIPLIQAITGEKEDIDSAIFMLAYRCVAECQNQNHPLISKLINMLEILWHLYPNSAPVFSAIVLLGQVNEEVFEKIQQKLYDKDNRIKYSAILALGAIHNPQAIEKLIPFLDDEDLLTRGFTIYALGRIGEPRLVKKLTYVLHHDTFEPHKAYAAMALEKIGSPEAIEVLISAISHEYVGVRIVASQALIKIGSQRVIEGLTAFLSHEQSDVREWASDTLDKIGSPAAIEALKCSQL